MICFHNLSLALATSIILMCHSLVLTIGSILSWHFYGVQACRSSTAEQTLNIPPSAASALADEIDVTGGDSSKEWVNISLFNLAHWHIPQFVGVVSAILASICIWTKLTKTGCAKLMLPHSASPPSIKHKAPLPLPAPLPAPPPPPPMPLPPEEHGFPMVPINQVYFQKHQLLRNSRSYDDLDLNYNPPEFPRSNLEYSRRAPISHMSQQVQDEFNDRKMVTHLGQPTLAIESSAPNRPQAPALEALAEPLAES